MAASIGHVENAGCSKKLSFQDVINEINDDTDEVVDSEDSWSPSGSGSDSSEEYETFESVDKTTLAEKDTGNKEVSKRGRRRTRNPSEWKRNIRARKRLRGEEYVGNKGKVYAPKLEGQPCNCKKHCFAKIDAVSRLKLRDAYYDLPSFTAQRNFLGNCIKCENPKRRYGNKDSKRQKTYVYSFTVNAENVPVCKQALASILGITIAKINYVCDSIKKQDTPGKDMRGKHQSRPNKISEDRKQVVLDFIDSVPKYRSHYTRRHNPNRHYLSPELTQKLLFERYTEKCSNLSEEPVTYRMFQEIFVTERNYHFGQPSLDTCKTCDKLEMLIKADPGDEALASEKELHLRKADSAQSAMKHDFQSATEINSAIWTIAFDFQQTLPTPHINTSVTFYSRQLWTYNFGIHDAKNVFMNMWSEDTAGRGSSEVLSSLNSYISAQTTLPKHLIAWSDSCGGQNKNKNVVSFWYYAVHVAHYFETVEHKFPIPGHTFLPCDRDFGVIEKKKRKTPAVYTPEGWFTLVEKSRVHNPFKVVRMSQKTDFIDINPMKERLTFRNKAIDGSKVNIQKAMRIKIDINEPCKIQMAYTHNLGESWQEINVGQRGQIGDVELPTLYNGRRPIVQAKLNDLKKLCNYIPVQHRNFYAGLQAAEPSPRKLRKGFSTQQTANQETSDEETDVETPSSDSSSDSD